MIRPTRRGRLHVGTHLFRACTCAFDISARRWVRHVPEFECTILTGYISGCDALPSCSPGIIVKPADTKRLLSRDGEVRVALMYCAESPDSTKRHAPKAPAFHGNSVQQPIRCQNIAGNDEQINV